MTVGSWTPDAVQLIDDIRAGRRSAEEIVAEAIERIEAWDGTVNSIIHRLWELRSLDPPDTGLFAGVPMVVKDFGCQTAGDPYHEGMEVLRSRNWTATTDSDLATRFMRAGLTIIGRSNVPELATSYTTEPVAYGPTRNPWDIKRSAGGSSGGSAAAVALGVVPIAHGGDGGGSIRVPASMCGVVGLKPTRGRISINDTQSYSGMLATEGVMARSIRDVASVLDQVSGGSKVDPFPSPVPIRSLTAELDNPPKGLRIGVRLLVPYEQHHVHPDCIAAVAHAARVLEELGHHVFEAEVRSLDDAAVGDAGGRVYFVGVALAVRAWSARLGVKLRPRDLEPRNAWLMEMSRKVSTLDYATAIQTLQQHTARVVEHWEREIDVLLTPTVPEPPPLIGMLGTQEGPELGRFASPFNITGQPALSLPLHWNDQGLPIGIQLVGDMGREDLLLRVGRQLEQARPWSHRRPPAANPAIP